MSYVEEYLQGQDDCRKGVDHEDGRGVFYDRGYNDQYVLEQQRSEATKCS